MTKEDIDKIQVFLASIGSNTDAFILFEDMRKDYEDLKWFESQVNKYVLPGTTDTQDATSILVKKQREALRVATEALEKIAKDCPYLHHEVGHYSHDLEQYECVLATNALRKYQKE